MVGDAHRGIGLGRRLMEDLIAAARDRGLRAMEGETLANNEGMLGLAERLGFTIRASADDPGIRIMRLDLRGTRRWQPPLPRASVQWRWQPGTAKP